MTLPSTDLLYLRDDERVLPLNGIKTPLAGWTRIDTDDYTRLSRYNWTLTDEGYVYGYTGDGNYAMMHRVVLGAGEGEIVDHINGDKTDNRRANLRLCNNSENMKNRGPQANNKTGYKGVSPHKASGKYLAQITVDGRVVYLGIYRSPEDAARAYDEAAEGAYGDFAWLNFREGVGGAS